jgi:hypothetical protein
MVRDRFSPVNDLPTHGLLLSVLTHLHQADIAYCLLRDGEQLEQIAVKGEADLLVDRSQLAQVCGLLARLGFVTLPNWGHAPHHFFVAYDAAADRWLKLDVVTEIAYGQPVRALQTALAGPCLVTRQHSGLAFTPAPEYELVMLLLHCLLDKGTITLAHGQRLQTLRQQVSDEPVLAELLATYWQPTMPWSQVADHIDSERWSALLAARPTVARRLAARDRLGTLGRQIGKRLLRKLNSWIQARRPSAINVALLAPDGAGKSTLTEGIQQSFYFPVRTLYMGLYQKGSGKRLHLPLPGAGLLERLLTQWGRYGVARYHQMRRRLVVFDRYTYDALLAPRQSQSRPKRWRRWLLAHACPAPDLVILLDAPGELLYARKGEHSAALLEQQRQQYLALRPHLPQMAVVDATQEADQVRRTVLALIWRSYLGRQAGLKTSQVVGELATDIEGVAP